MSYRLLCFRSPVRRSSVFLRTANVTSLRDQPILGRLKIFGEIQQKYMKMERDETIIGFFKRNYICKSENVSYEKASVNKRGSKARSSQQSKGSNVGGPFGTPPKISGEAQMISTAFPMYLLVVGIAVILTLNYEPPATVVGRLSKIEWHELFQNLIGTNGGVALTVYPSAGVVVSPSSLGFVENVHSDYASDQNSLNSRRRFNIVPIPSQDSYLITNFIDFIVQQTGIMYHQLDIVYRMFLNKKGGLKGVPDSKMMNNLNESMNERFGEEHMVKNASIKFKDVIGCEEAKMEIKEFVSYMKSPERFENLGARIPTGAILYGPPGTGKTMLAKALAAECDTKFFACSGSDFVQMFVGVGAARVRNLFNTARKHRPSVIFIDEIDAVATDRNVSNFSFSEKESTLNQLLSEMDGFKDNKDVIVIAGTNKFSYLDKAILRPGRFDRHIYVGAPDLEGRTMLFKNYMKPLKLSSNCSINKIAEKLALDNPGYTGAYISNMCNEAAIIAAREGANGVDLIHFDKASDRIRIGAQTGKDLTSQDRHVVAVHEAGHALVGWNLETVTPLKKVTISPRGGALGFAQYTPREFNFMSKQQLYEQMVLLFGGRAAEEAIIGEITTSARDDIQKATTLAYQIVGVFGMDSQVQNLSFYSMTDHKAGFFGEKREFSTKIGDIIDRQVADLIQSAYNEAKLLVVNNKDSLIQITNLLARKETIIGSEVEALLGPKKYHNEERDFIFPPLEKIESPSTTS